MTITESDLWKRLKPKFKAAGALPIRLENAANMSVPDVALIGCDATSWVELKIARGDLVYIPKHQFSFANELARTINRNLFWMIVYHKGNVRILRYCDIIENIEGVAGENVVFDVTSHAEVYTLEYVTAFIHRFGKEGKPQ